MLGQRIFELRAACGWSQVELAKKLSVAKQTVSNWENENIQVVAHLQLLIEDYRQK